MSLRAAFRRGAGLACAAAAVAAVAPATAQDGWSCSEALCIETEPAVIAVEQGVFEPALTASPDTHSDRFAALEQQRWREFRYLVRERATVIAVLSAEPGPRPPDWPEDVALPGAPVTLSLHASGDGERYDAIGNGRVVEPGTQLSILVAQRTETLDGGVRFFPSRWQFRLEARRAAPPAALPGPRSGAPLVRDGETRALGCAVPGCGEAPATVSAPPVTGTAAPDPAGPPPTAPVPRSAPDPLARQLQAELARLGCYTVAVDGLWGPGSRRALEAFNRATGGTHPVGRPTPAALAAAARTTARVCPP